MASGHAVHPPALARVKPPAQSRPKAAERQTDRSARASERCPRLPECRGENLRWGDEAQKSQALGKYVLFIKVADVCGMQPARRACAIPASPAALGPVSLADVKVLA